jgi:hypothetical protein
MSATEEPATLINNASKLGNSTQLKQALALALQNLGEDYCRHVLNRADATGGLPVGRLNSSRGKSQTSKTSLRRRTLLEHALAVISG